MDRRFLADLAKEFGLNALHLEALGESCQWEIVVGGDILERLVEIQCQFKRLAVMGDRKSTRLNSSHSSQSRMPSSA